MIKTLINLDENLASSIALRYASHLGKLIDMQMHIIHIEEVEQDRRSGGSGWVRKTWEKGVMEAGADVIRRLLKTEKVDCTFASAPRILIGDRDDEILEELVTFGHQLFIEGTLSTSKIKDFQKLISGKLYTKSPCPMLIVKNLITSNKVAIVCGDGVDHQKLIPHFAEIFRGSDIDLELVCYKFQESSELLFLDKSEAGSTLAEAEALLTEAGLAPKTSKVLSGPPELAGEYLGGNCLTVSTFPTRKGPRMELLAQTPSPVMLCR